MLQDLRKWAFDTDAQTTILWLYGPAGAGKSAIMQTLARELQDAGRLGGSFFFKRGHVARGNAKKLFATIAYQLALSIPWLRTPISRIVENDPSIVVRSIETQIQKLISEPCRPHAFRDPVTIAIDGLDECEGHNIQEEILRSMRNSSQHPIPLRFIISSRPEPHICEMFDSVFSSGHYHSLNVEQSFDDVRQYLHDEFLRIYREHHHTMASIPWPWPPSHVLERLVRQSSGHFIYASTIIKFIDNKNYRPTEMLAVVQDKNAMRMGSQLVFDELDKLYMTILCSSPRESQLIPILCAIANFDLAAGEIDQLFELAGGETRLLLRGLHSVFHIPPDDTDSVSKVPRRQTMPSDASGYILSPTLCASTPYRMDRFLWPTQSYGKLDTLHHIIASLR
ncbi:putative nwd2 protein [Mycena sanguinolenta]|uniref:Putative nwd2 protein n=1 Tax=Mycena sanguinolenta TaxID=230812 RepID=A0A8H6XTX5_9AGAR|nr:putative nwd2 protein [Mycena sanguinolenta]